MSKIIILAEPVDGHINPFLPIMTKLISKDHEVICITGRRYKEKIENIGALFQPLSVKWDPEDQETYDFFPELKSKKGLAQIKYYLKHILYDQVPDTLECLRGVLKGFPADVIISDTFMVAGNWITELGGPPSIRLSVLPLSLPGENIAPFGLGILPGNSLLSKCRNNLLSLIFDKILFKDVQNYASNIRKTVGLPAFDKSFFTKGYEIPNLVLHTSTPAFEYFREKKPQNLKFIGPVLIAPKNDFNKPSWWSQLEQDRPVILITQGTVAKNYDDLIRPSIEALKDKNVTVLAVGINKGELTNLPKNTFTASYIPFGNLLPHVDIMITNGGFGGTQNALAHGVPVIITGATEDKMEVAARVENSGAGINLRQPKNSVEAIKLAVMKILSDPSFKIQAKALQADFSNFDAPTLAVKWIETLIENTKYSTS